MKTLKNLKSKGSTIALVCALFLAAWWVANPSETNGQVGLSRGNTNTVPLADPAPSFDQLMAGNGTPLTCITSDFETGAQGFTVQPVAGPALWHIANNVCGAQSPGHSLTSAFYYGRDSDCTYIEGTRSASNLISPAIPIPTSLRPVVVSFNYLLQIESGSFDAISVDISVNNGASYSTLFSKANLINNGTWQNASAFISDAFLGSASSIKLRFRFDTLDSIINDTRGWLVDDVQVCSQAVDFCVQDDANGNVLVFNKTTGDYSFSSCRKGVQLNGKGVVSQSSCKVELLDNGPVPKSPDRSVAVLVNPCTKKGDGSVSIFSTGQTYSINDANTTDNLCRCP